jgi:hypothetical protein
MDRILAVTPALVAVAAVCVAHTSACTSSADGAAPIVAVEASLGAGEAGAAEDGADAPSDAVGDSPEDAVVDAPPPPPDTFLRFANWSSVTPSVDVCTAPQGTTTFAGPLVAGLIDGGAPLGEGGAPGLPFPLVTADLAVAPGSYDVRFVVGGATACDAPVVPDLTVTLAQGQYSLVALFGDPAGGSGGAPALQLTSFMDEIVVPASGPLRLRFINAVPDMSPAALGTGTLLAGTFVAMFPAVPFGQASSEIEDDAAVGGVDDAGYGAVRNLSATVLSAHASDGTTDEVVTMPVFTESGTPVTIVAVGGSGHPISLVECLDSAGTAGATSACAVLP